MAFDERWKLGVGVLRGYREEGSTGIVESPGLTRRVPYVLLSFIVMIGRLRFGATSIFLPLYEMVSVSLTPRPLHLTATIQLAARRAADGVWEKRRGDKSLSLPGINVI
jgi:hypothetical protein